MEDVLPVLFLFWESLSCSEGQLGAKCPGGEGALPEPPPPPPPARPSQCVFIDAGVEACPQGTGSHKSQNCKKWQEKISCQVCKQSRRNALDVHLREKEARAVCL